MEKQKIEMYLEDLSFKSNFISKGNRTVSEKILDRLIGTRRTSRLGPSPDEGTRKIILKNIELKREANEPLEITSAWGGIKTVSGMREVDLAEFYTFLQYLAVAESVKEVYSPGVVYNIFVGDAYWEYIYGRNSLVDEYLVRLRSLVNFLGRDVIRIFSLKDIHKKMPGLVSSCDKNLKLFSEYWEESEDAQEEEWASLESYLKLISEGWIGTVPSVMREHYLKRLRGLLPEVSEKDRIHALNKFFAYGMMVKQKDLFGRKDPYKCTADFCLLQLPPPGMPRQLHSNRIRICFGGFLFFRRSNFLTKFFCLGIIVCRWD